MDLVKLLSKLQAISEAEDKKADKDYDKDGEVESEKDEVWGSRMKAAEKSKANEDIMNVLKGLKAIQEGKCSECGHDPCDCDDHDHKDEKLDECGEMEIPMAADGAEASPLTMMGADGAEMEPEANVPATPEIKDRFTLTITKADGSTLNATTDVPDEITALMKAIGMAGKATVAPAGQQPEGAVEEEFGNTPNATGEREPSLKGQTKDWGLPGQGAGKPEYPGTKASGDNPMAESMFKEYLKFKAGK